MPGLQTRPLPGVRGGVIVSPTDMAMLKHFFIKFLPLASNLTWDRSIVPLGRAIFLVIPGTSCPG